MKQQGERGFILALALFAIVALTIVGMTSVFLASGEAQIAGNLRRQREAARCADAGAAAMIAQLPDPTGVILSNNNPYTYFVGSDNAGFSGFSAYKGHYTGTGYTANPAAPLSPTQVPGIYTPGENMTNQAGGQSGQQPYRLVASCNGPNGAQAEQSVGVLYRTGR